MRHIIVLLILSTQVGYSQLLYNDTVKATIEKEFKCVGIKVKKGNGEFLLREVESKISIRTFGTLSDTLNTDLVFQIDRLSLKSSIDVYNFLMGWIPFDCGDKSPLEGLPMLYFRGTRTFLAPEDKEPPFLEGTQQIFSGGKSKYIIIFSSISITIIKRDGSYIEFYF